MKRLGQIERSIPGQRESDYNKYSKVVTGERGSKGSALAHEVTRKPVRKMSGQEGRGGRGEWEGKELLNDSKVSERITEQKRIKGTMDCKE